jgi:hypothetical protein
LVRIRGGLLTRGGHASEIAGKGKGLRGLVGPKGDTGWAGCKAKEGKGGPVHRFDILQIKRISFELGFELEFEFDSHSNSNFTHLNSKRTKEKPTHIFYHNLNIYMFL